MDSQWYLVYFPLTIFALYIFTNYFLHKLRNLSPTPILNLPFIGHLYLLKKPLHRTLAKISSRYGSVLVLQFGFRRVLVVSSPSAAEECLAKNDVVFANRPNLLIGKYIGSNFTTVAWSSYGDHWRNLRKISSLEILSMKRLQMLHGIRADEVKYMIQRLNRGAAAEEERGGLVDMKVVFFELTMNVMMKMIAGKRYYGENLEDVEGAKRFREMTKEIFGTPVETNSRDFLPMLGWLGVGGRFEKRYVELEKKKDKFMQELVEECKTRIMSTSTTGGGDDDDDDDDDDDGKRKRNNKTMIEVLLELQEKEPEYYKDKLIRDFMLSLLVGGTSTTAGTLEWALSLLLNNPHILKKAQLEIENCVGNKRLLDESDMAKLPYLHCIVKETLRMYPIGPLLIPHESSKECMVEGYRVPTGTMLLVNCWAIQNDPKNWEDPQEFKPERFEEAQDEGLFKLLTFGFGRRGCPGEGLAMRMLGVGLGSVIQCFDWERVEKNMYDMSEGFGVTMTRAQPLMAYCKARPVAAKLFS